MVEREGDIRSVVATPVMAANARLPAAWQLLTAWHLRPRESPRERVTSLVEFAGTWQSQHGLPEPASTLGKLRETRIQHLAFDARQVTAWDSGLVTFVLKVLGEVTARAVAADRAGLPDGVRRLSAMAEAVPERQTGRTSAVPPWLSAHRQSRNRDGDGDHGRLDFLGENLVALGALVRGRARFSRLRSPPRHSGMRPARAGHRQPDARKAGPGDREGDPVARRHARGRVIKGLPAGPS
jgi:hypothetical protein